MRLPIPRNRNGRSDPPSRHLPSSHGHPHLRNTVQAGLLLASLTVLMLFCGWLYAGIQGAVIAAVMGVAGLAFAQKIPLHLLLRMNGAERLMPHDVPGLNGIVGELCLRAGLAHIPLLYAVPGAVPTAFTLGTRSQTALVVSGALLRLLPLRELTAVLAHEIAHIRRHDVELMQLAAAVGMVIRTIARVAILIALMTVWLAFFDPTVLHIPELALLVTAPILANMLQLALSRSREYEADLEAVELTGDPDALAAALEHIEAAQERMLDRMVPGATRIRLPRLLSSHPDPKARIRRIREYLPCSTY